MTKNNVLFLSVLLLTTHTGLSAYKVTMYNKSNVPIWVQEFKPQRRGGVQEQIKSSRKHIGAGKSLTISVTKKPFKRYCIMYLQNGKIHKFCLLFGKKIYILNDGRYKRGKLGFKRKAPRWTGKMVNY